MLAGCLAELPTPSRASRHGAGFPLLLPNPSHTAKETKAAEIILYRRLLLLADMGETLQARTLNAPTRKAWLVLNPLVSAARPSLPAFEVNNGKAGLSLLTPGKKKINNYFSFVLKHQNGSGDTATAGRAQAQPTGQIYDTLQ